MMEMGAPVGDVLSGCTGGGPPSGVVVQGEMSEEMQKAVGRTPFPQEMYIAMMNEIFKNGKPLYACSTS